MRRFETTGLEPEVARLLQGMDSQTLSLAGDDAAFSRLQSFHDAIYDDDQAVEQTLLDGSKTLLGRACFSAVSLDGWLIGARHRIRARNEPIAPPYYVVGTTSIYTDQPIGWRASDGSYDATTSSLELTVESQESPRPLLSVVEDEPLSPLEMAWREIARQEDEERRRLNSIRVRIGSNATWQLLRQDYKTEPLKATGNLLASVPLARMNGLIPESPSIQQEIIDNHG